MAWLERPAGQIDGRSFWNTAAVFREARLTGQGFHLENGMAGHEAGHSRNPRNLPVATGSSAAGCRATNDNSYRCLPPPRAEPFHAACGEPEIAGDRANSGLGAWRRRT